MQSLARRRERHSDHATVTAPAAAIGERDALTRIDTHEAVCAERWRLILARMDRLEHVIMGAAGALIVGMAALIATLIFHGHPT